jgi:hypothetical protein
MWVDCIHGLDITLWVIPSYWDITFSLTFGKSSDIVNVARRKEGLNGNAQSLRMVSERLGDCSRT